MQKKQAGLMRLSREARAAQKDLDAQIKKTGKVADNFVCLPDPEDPFTWYYVVFGMDDHPLYKGGYFFGRIKCPPEYPAKAPKVIVMTKNGRFHTWENGICLSISDYHPESWNPVWKVNQVVIGLLSYWIVNEYTYGAVERYDCEMGDFKEFDDWKLHQTIHSREHVLNHPKFKQIFAPYASAIGIDKEPEMPQSWIDHNEKYAKIFAQRAEEKKQREIAAEAEKKVQEKARLEEEAKQARARAREEYQRKNPELAFLALLKKHGLTKYVGQPMKLQEKLKKIRNQEAAPAGPE